MPRIERTATVTWTGNVARGQGHISAGTGAFTELPYSLPVRIATGTKKERMAFDEDLLFTHRGLSGPAVLQISSYWREGTAIRIDS